MRRSTSYAIYCIQLLVLLVSQHLFSLPVLGQKSRPDSLLAALSKSADDTSKVNTLNELYKVYQNSNSVLALKYAKAAYELSEKIDFSRGKGSSLNNIGLYYFNQDSGSKALVYFISASDIFTQIEFNKGKSIALANIGNIFNMQGNYPKAIEYYFNSLAAAQELQDSSRVAMLLENIGMIYYEQGYYSKALDLCLRSLKISENLKDKKGIAYVYGNIGEIYDSWGNPQKTLEYYNKSLAISKEIGDSTAFATSLTNIGELYLQMGDKKKAIESYQLALKIYTEIGYQSGISTCLLNIGDYYRAQKNYTKALEYFIKEDKLRVESNDKKAQANALGLIGDVYSAQGNYSGALSNYKQSIEIAEELGIKELLKQNYDSVSRVYFKMGNFEEAYKYHLKFSDIKDSLYNKESITQIANMQTKYETEKQEEEITLLKKESELQSLKLGQNKIIIYSVIAVFFLLSLLTLFIFNNYRHRQRVRQLNAEIALRESEEKYRDLANLLPQIMFEVDNKNRLTFINTAGLAMTGYYVEDIMDGILITDIFAHDEKEKLLENLKEVYNGLQSKSQEYSARRKDTTIFPVLCYFNQYTDRDKNQGLRGIAIDITELKQIERRILSKVIETEEKERKRVAKDLHDGLGPLLSSIKLYVNELQSGDTDESEKNEMLKYTNELIDDAVSSTRTIANNLMPGIISDYGLVKALQSFCGKLNIAKSINISFNADNDSRRYDNLVEITLYRVLMELINNSIKHASAKNIDIVFKEINSLLVILFKDDGVGFDISKTLKDPKIGMGLNNIINRVKSIQGICEFQSEPGNGTIVRIEIDLQQI